MTDQTINSQTKPNLEAFQALIELDKKERNFQSRQNYFRAYIFSLVLPPVGLFYFLKFCFFADGTDEDIKAGIISLVVTLFSLIISIWFVNILFKTTTSSLPIQNNAIKELITPENQKKLRDLLQ